VRPGFAGKVVGSIHTKVHSLTICPSFTSFEVSETKNSISVAPNNPNFAWWSTNADRRFQPAGEGLGLWFTKSGSTRWLRRDGASGS